MSQQPTLLDKPRYGEWFVVNGLLTVGFIILVTPVTAVIAWYFERRYWRRLRHGVLVISAFWGMVVSYKFARSGWFSFSHWVLTLPATPAASGVLRGMYMLSHFLKPRSLEEQLAEEQKRLEQAQAASREATASSEQAGPPQTLMLGPKIKGDSFPAHIGMAYQDGWLTLQQHLLDQHLFILGSTGTGKSETIKRLVLEILKHTSRSIYLVDGKGDEQLANDIRTLAFHHGRGEAPVFRLGFDKTGAIYDGFRGQAPDVYNRLCALVGVDQIEGPAAYYADINRDLLQLICFGGEQPPRSFEEVRARLRKDWLRQAYAHDEVELHTIEHELADSDLQGLSRRIRPLAREFAPIVGPEGFALEDSSCAIFSIRVQSVGDTAERFLDFLVEDLKDFAGKRQKHPGVLIIDEFGQFSNDNIIALLTLARSSQLGVILATQDTASLKDENTKKNVLANTRTKILMGTDFPQEVAELAGTTYQVETSMQHQDGDVTGLGSARFQHTFKVDMNEVAKLQAGEAFVIRQRYTAKIKVKRVDALSHIPEQVAMKREVSKESGAKNQQGKKSGPVKL